ncbi:MAG: ATP-binding protein [Chthoniobacter sp.]
MEKIANETFLKNIEIKVILPDDLWPVVGDPTQLHQVLLNLCVNARDAMPHGGRLTLSAENVMIDAHYAGLAAEAKPGSYVLLQIEDNGVGIAPEIVERIFDPSLPPRTSARARGSDFPPPWPSSKVTAGSSKCTANWGAARNSKSICRRTRGRRGEAGGATPMELPRGNGELILVVDDESSVRQVTRQTLEAFGYRVILAVDGVWRRWRRIAGRPEKSRWS